MDTFVIRAIPAPRLEAEAREAIAALRALLPPEVEVHEVGSTAIPGVIGKGDIDLLVRAPAEGFEDVRATLDGRYARNEAQLSNARYQGYVVDSELDVAIQLTVRGCEHDDFLPFLEALRGSPELVEAYNALKRSWDGRPMAAYREAKSGFIRSVLDAPVG